MTNLNNHDALCKEIATFQIDGDETLSVAVLGTVSGTPRPGWYTQAGHQQRRPNTFAVRSSLDSQSHQATSLQKEYSAPPPEPRYPRRREGLLAAQRSSSLYLPTSLDHDDIDSIDSGADKAKDKILMTGWLYKTSLLKTSKARGNRQPRKFKLTSHSLEYSHFLQKIKVRKQFPLTSINDLIYDEIQNPAEFKLVFQKVEMILEAHDHSTCKQWVQNIMKGWKQWNIAYKQINVTDSNSEDVTECVTEDTTDPETISYLKKNQDYLEAALKNLKCNTPGLVTSSEVARHYFASKSKANLAGLVSKHIPSNSVQCLRRNALRRFQTRIGLSPRVKHDEDLELLSNDVDNKHDLTLLSKSSFAMIKYSRKGHSIPHERVFKTDFENLLIMWHQTEDSKFSYLQTLLIDSIVDVREGQDSDGFDRYPYEEMNNQSLSIVVEGEKPSAVPGSRRYAVLQSFDLICESPEEQQLWCRVLRQLISSKHQLYSPRFESTDPTIFVQVFLTFIGWLTTHWSVLTNGGEIKEDAALCFGSKLVPQFTHSRIQELLSRAHQCQLKESQHRGHSLHWDGFIFFFNLLCEVDKSTCLLLKIFQKYAETYSLLGMTVEEFKKFLIEYQQWSPEDATNAKCVQLMVHYDYHYRAYKMDKANSSPFEFNMSLCLLSFGGFLSFLKSPDNSVINREHENIYQDMTQPLSHYFINSSHNTYLEGHQLTGLSTTDAYVRALLQGCRCLELDCWDGPDGQPRVTHGKTLVSGLSLEEVTETINKYAFSVSDYPLILSLENHCSSEQQARMAEIFTRIFGEKLAKENLVKIYDLDRLPSPHQLQRKIILKGTDRTSIKTPKKSPQPILGKLRKTSSAATPFINPEQRMISQVSVPESTNTQHPVASEPQLDKLDKCCDVLADDDLSQQEDIDDDNDDIEENDLSEDLSDLIVYCRSKRIRPWNWDMQKETSVCNMFSFSESSALSRCRDTTEMLACTERQFVRTYPAGTRIDSSNYDPIPLWNHGIQMVALNVQTPENFMYLNQGKFRHNGGCGYILKPKIMRDPFNTEYNPNVYGPIKKVTPLNLEITPLCGQHLIVPSKRTVTMEIHCETYGIPHDCEKTKNIFHSHDTNPLWPQFHGASKLEKTIHMPELCLVLFTVSIRVSRKLQAGTKQIFLGQNVFPLESLKPGLHFIPLRTPTGESTPHIGIFARIKTSKLSQEQASSSEMCDLKSPSKGLSPLSFLDTCKFNLDKRVEHKMAVKEVKLQSKEENTISACSLSDCIVDRNNADLAGKPASKIKHQEAIEFTVKIHTNSS